MTADQIDLFAEIEPDGTQDIIELQPPRQDLETSALDWALTCEDVAHTVQAFSRVMDEVWSLNHHSWSTFSDCVSLFRNTLMRHSLGAEERYMETVSRMQQDAVRVAPKAFGILVEHFVSNMRFEDILGSVYMDVAGKWKQAGLGQFFTPWPVCLLMAEMTLNDLERPTRENMVRINEPCVGSGSMLLAVRSVVAHRWGREATYWLRVSGQDIDPLCVEMAEVQLMLTDDRFMSSWAMANIPELQGQEVCDV